MDLLFLFPFKKLHTALAEAESQVANIGETQSKMGEMHHARNWPHTKFAPSSLDKKKLAARSAAIVEVLDLIPEEFGFLKVR